MAANSKDPDAWRQAGLKRWKADRAAQPQHQSKLRCRECGLRIVGEPKHAVELAAACPRCGSRELPRRFTESQALATEQAARDRLRRLAARAIQRLSQAGIDAAVDEEMVTTNGHSHSIWSLTNPDRFFGPILEQNAPTLILEQTRRALRDFPFGVEVIDGRVFVSYAGEQIARAAPTGMDIFPRGDRPARRVDGDCFREGLHWSPIKSALTAPLAAERAEDAVERAAREAAAAHNNAVSKQRSKPAPSRRQERTVRDIETHPSAAPPAVLELMIADSRRLRTERRRAFARTVELRWEGEILRLLPIPTRGAALELPFEFEGRAGKLEGGLRLNTPGDPPLALSIYETDLQNHLFAWCWALHAAAELTCTPPAPPASEPMSAQPPRTGASTDRRTNAAPGKQTSSEERTDEWPTTWRPTPKTKKQIEVPVQGFVRYIGTQSASPAAIARAAAEGITLAADETWVQPFTRDGGAPLVFGWAPTQDFALVAALLRDRP